MRRLCFFGIVVCVLVFSSTGCGRESDAVSPALYYEPNDLNVVLMVIDGARYSEMFGDSTHKNIPMLRSLMRQGTVCTKMYIDGVTNTVNGHAAMCTGHYESLNNGGQQLPTSPSFMQHWRKATGADSSKSWIITSKDKLEVLADCSNPAWRGRYKPTTDCGNNGNGSGYREDSITFNNALMQLQLNQPKLMLINLKEPDVAGHSGDWPLYLDGIRKGDAYAYRLWSFLQNHPFYKNNTVLIITNDHGRHTDGWSNGFVSHGDNCDGCRHISFMALGAGIKKGHVDTTTYSQTDIAATVSHLLGIHLPYAEDQVMQGILDF